MKIPELVLKNCRIVYPEGIISGDIGIGSGKITAVGKNLSGNRVIDLTGKLILPGLIDTHVHFREPGYPDKEDWLTGSSAAAAGGVTTVLDMPNNIPPTTTTEILEQKRAIAKAKSVVDYGFHFGASLGNIGEIRKAKNIASVKFFLGSSTGNIQLEDDKTLSEEFSVLAKRGIIAYVHAEDESIIKEESARLKSAGRADPAVHSEARPPIAAVKAIEKSIRLSKKAENRLHIAHISTKEELALMPKRGGKITCEATPHHLFFSTKDYARLGNLIKTNPPVRSEEEKKALWSALKKGGIDIIASDHAPHTLESKEKDVWSAPSGVPGVETMLPLMLNEVNKKNISINQLVKLTSQNPAKIFGIKSKGQIKKGYDADIVVVDLMLEKKITADQLHSKCGWTPYEGRAVKGWPVMTFVRGQLVFDHGNINKIRGLEVSYV